LYGTTTNKTISWKASCSSVNHNNTVVILDIRLVSGNAAANEVLKNVFVIADHMVGRCLHKTVNNRPQNASAGGRRRLTAATHKLRDVHRRMQANTAEMELTVTLDALGRPLLTYTIQPVKIAIVIT